MATQSAAELFNSWYAPGSGDAQTGSRNFGINAIAQAMGYGGNPFVTSYQQADPQNGIMTGSSYSLDPAFLSALNGYTVDETMQGNHPAVNFYNPSGGSLGQFSVGDGGSNRDTAIDLAVMALMAGGAYSAFAGAGAGAGAAAEGAAASGAGTGAITSGGLEALNTAAAVNGSLASLPSVGSVTAGGLGTGAGLGAITSAGVETLGSVAPEVAASLNSVPAISSLPVSGGLLGTAASTVAQQALQQGAQQGAQNGASNALGNALTNLASNPATIGAIVGGVAGLAGGNDGPSNTSQNKLDPRIEALIYGSNGGQGLLGAATDYFNTHKGGNADVQNGATMIRNTVNSPMYQNGYNQLSQAGLGLLSGANSNPFMTAFQNTQGGRVAMPDLTQYQQPSIRGLLG